MMMKFRVAEFRLREARADGASWAGHEMVIII
jgi:hypothetical protein